jgi:hypothetical protein
MGEMPPWGVMGAEENLMKTTPLFFSEWVLTL